MWSSQADWVRSTSHSGDWRWKKRQKHQLQDTRTPTSNILMSTRQMKPTPRGVGHTTLTSEWPTRVYYLGGKYKYAGAKLRGSSDQTLWGTRPCIYDLQSCVLGALRRLISLRQLPTYLPANRIITTISSIINTVLILDSTQLNNQSVEWSDHSLLAAW